MSPLSKYPLIAVIMFLLNLTDDSSLVLMAEPSSAMPVKANEELHAVFPAKV